jgi:hypothetical protein
MFNHTAVAKAFATAACTLAIALLTTGMGVNSSWAGSDQPSGMSLASLTTSPSHQTSPNHLKNKTLANACSPLGGCCSWGPALAGWCNSSGPTTCCAGACCHPGGTGPGFCVTNMSNCR